jgi:ribosomal-protein-alanine N-acetyltransferase
LSAPAVSLVSNGTASDAASIDAIARACTMDHGFAALEEFARPWARIWVAARDARSSRALEAFLVAWHVADELHVLNVATAPPARCAGLGSALLEAALAYAAVEHVRLVLLEVRRSNRDAIRLYRRFGFTAMGVRPGYYADDGEDAIEMVLSLDPMTGATLPGRDEIRIDVSACRG